MLPQPNKATANRIKSTTTVPMSPHDQAKSAVKVFGRKGLQGYRNWTENPAHSCLPVEQR